MIKHLMVAALIATVTMGASATSRAATPSADKSLFTEGEITLCLGAQSSFIGSDLGSDFGLSARVDRGFDDKFAVGAGITLNDLDGSLIDEALIQVTLALPLQLPVTTYAYAHVGYAWQGIDSAFLGVGAGAEYAIERDWSLYADLGYRLYDENDANGWVFRVGVRLHL